jgi:hypothetical protein
VSDESVLGPDPIQTARDLQHALEGMTGQLAGVKADVRRGKRIITGLVISLVLDVALTVVVTITAAQAHDASARANATVGQLHATQVSSCDTGNQTRAAEVALWDHIFALSVTARTTPAERTADEQLLAFIREAFAARNCAQIYATK